MPLYSYTCDDCGSEEEHLQRHDDPPVETCAACGGRLRRRIVGTSFQLRGGGWYRDLYSSPRRDGGSGS